LHNAALKRAVTGLADDDPEQEREFCRQWTYDFIWATNDGPEPWETRGRTTDMGHAEFLEGGSDRREAQRCPFRDVEEVLAFDAVAEYGLTDPATLAVYYEAGYRQARTRFPEQVYTGGYYRTLVSGAIAIFGWDLLLEAAADRRRFARVLDGIFQQAMHHYRAWAQTSIEVFMCHDDMVWTQGPFMRPDFYRAEVFRRYRELWQVLKQAGKKVVFTSDGDYTLFVDDVVAAGADALCFEPMTALAPIVERYGRSHCLIGSMVDARTLTFGSRAQIQAEIDATLPLAARCHGFIFAVGNHILATCRWKAPCSIMTTCASTGSAPDDRATRLRPERGVASARHLSSRPARISSSLKERIMAMPEYDAVGDWRWWAHDRLGMFIHWGLYALPARHEWVKNIERITDADYQRYFDHFDPDLYDPQEWAAAARRAGFKYVVLTTKHHEGFCLWDSRYTDYKVTRTPYGRDLLHPFVDAFRARGYAWAFITR
jgi:hypothetical protein